MIVDTSALLAMIRREKGAEIAAELAPGAFVSALTWVETNAWIQRKLPVAAPEIERLELRPLPFGPAEAEIAIRLLAAHHGRLSLGDCACLATAEVHGLPVLTADRIWAGLGLPVEVRLIR